MHTHTHSGHTTSRGPHRAGNRRSATLTSTMGSRELTPFTIHHSHGHTGSHGLTRARVNSHSSHGLTLVHVNSHGSHRLTKTQSLPKAHRWDGARGPVGCLRNNGEPSAPRPLGLSSGKSLGPGLYSRDLGTPEQHRDPPEKDTLLCQAEPGVGAQTHSPTPHDLQTLGSPTHTGDGQSTRGGSTGELTGEHTAMLTRAHTPTRTCTHTHTAPAAEAPTRPARPGTQGARSSCLGLSPVEEATLSLSLCRLGCHLPPLDCARTQAGHDPQCSGSAAQPGLVPSKPPPGPSGPGSPRRLWRGLWAGPCVPRTAAALTVPSC